VAAGGEQPLHADAVSHLGPGYAFADLLDHSGNLVAGHAGIGGKRKIPQKHVEIAVAHPAGVHLDQDFSALWLRNGTVFDDDGGVGLLNGVGFIKFSSERLRFRRSDAR